MRHLRKGRKLNRTASHRKALLRKLASDLFQHKRIITTEAKAKEVRPYAEKLITKAKNALARENQGLLPDNQTIDIHSRRVVARNIKNKEVLQELFDTIAPAVEERQGGYCRIVKLDFRRGDNAPNALIELVDWSSEQDGAVSKKPKKKSIAKPSPKVVEEEIETFDDIDDESTEVVEDDKTPADSVEPVQEDVAKSDDTPEDTVAPSEETPQDEEKVESKDGDEVKDEVKPDSNEDDKKDDDEKKKDE